MVRTYDLVIVGTGTAAMGVAMRVRAAGWRVAVIDFRPFGGTCALRGCDPKKVLVSGAETVDLVYRMRGHGVTGNCSTNWPDLMAFKRTFTDPVPEDNRQQYAEKGIEQQRRAASEEFLSERSRYKMQLASLLDVSTAEAGKAAAETSYERTEFDYERARAALQFATGGAPGPH